jgi:predicted nucleic acid-binding protein
MPEKKWIFDTVVLSNFAFSESFFILEKRYSGRGMITTQVYDEISMGIPDYTELEQIVKLVGNDVLSVVSLTENERKHLTELLGSLGKGEASCIAVANSRKAIMVTDDRLARKYCSTMKIPVTGTIGILKASLNDGIISLLDADIILRKMIKRGYYSPVRSMKDIC